MLRHIPPPGLTFAAKSCNGWLFMFRGPLMGRVQQVATLHCLSERRSGIITSWAILPFTPHLTHTLHLSFCRPFLGIHPVNLCLLTAPRVVKCLLTALPLSIFSYRCTPAIWVLVGHSECTNSATTLCWSMSHLLIHTILYHIDSKWYNSRLHKYKIPAQT